MTRLQNKIIAEITAEVQKWYNALPSPKGPITKYCHWWAYYTVEVLKRYNFNAQINAGTASWTVVRPEDDDGVSPTDFAYEFEWNRATFKTIQEGDFPEIHAWAAIAPHDSINGVGQIIDLTASFTLDYAKRFIKNATIGYPPLWFYLDEIPKGVAYRPSLQATALVHAVIESAETKIFLMPVLERLTD